MEMLMEVVDVCGFGDGLIDCAVVWKLGCGDEIESFLQHGELLWCEVMVRKVGDEFGMEGVACILNGVFDEVMEFV